MTLRKRRPDARYRAIKEAPVAPDHPVERALWQLLKANGEDQVVAYALEIYVEQYEREVMQAWLLSQATDEQIEHFLRVPQIVTAVYRHLFFDVTLFRDELTIHRWVLECEGRHGTSDDGAQLLRVAMTGGVDALAWLFGRGAHAVEADTVLRQVMTDAYFRGRSHRGFSIGSKEATAAHGFMKTAFTAAQSLSKRGPVDGVNALLIKLRHRDMTTSIDQEAKKEDILH